MAEWDCDENDQEIFVLMIVTMIVTECGCGTSFLESDPVSAACEWHPWSVLLWEYVARVTVSTACPPEISGCSGEWI